MKVSHLVSITLLNAAALAQGAIVSPVGAATVEGASGNSFPFASATVRRYMQIHSDLGSTPLQITSLSFRIGAGTTNYLGTRITDVELYMGEGVSALQPNYTMDNNYIGPRSLVIPRTFITFGPQGQAVTPGPNPFTSNMDFLLPAPFLYTGANSLIWELHNYGVTTGAAGSYNASTDAEQGIVTAGVSAITGTGCIATGQTAAMTHTFTCADIAGTLGMNSTVTAGPANSLCFLAVGFTNPNTVVPGLCTNVFSDGLVVKGMGTTNAAGAITTATPTFSTIIAPNVIAGATLYSQVFAIDVGSANPIPFATSNGRSVTVPAPNTTRVNLATRIFNTVGGVTATEGIYFPSTVGYALVTKFTHL